MPMPGVLRVDLHGKNAYQARVALDSALRRADQSVYRVCVVHGYQGGTALKELAATYAQHPRVLRVERTFNPGETVLVLRD